MTEPGASVPADDFQAIARAALASGDFSRVSPAALREVLTLAIKVYAAKAEAEGKLFSPVDEAGVTATEAVVTISELMRAANLNPFDVAMWYRRAPLPEDE